MEKLELIDVTVLIWYKSPEGEELMNSFDRKFFSHDIQWIAQQFAEVNNALCKIMNEHEVLATFDARK